VTVPHLTRFMNRLIGPDHRQPYVAFSWKILQFFSRIEGVRRGLLALIILLPIGNRAAIARDAVLLSSTIPTYVPGTVIAATDRLKLPDGANAVLLFQSGQMLRLHGPFEGTLERLQSASAGESVVALAEAFRLQGVDAAVIGGTRTIGARSHLALDSVTIDPRRSGIYCLLPSTSIWVSRPVDAGGKYGLRRRGSTRAIAFPATVERIEWPADISIEDGDQIDVLRDGVQQVTVIFRTMSERPASDAAWIAEGILRGCRDQFDLGLRELGQ
jgi:hypothetical protein